MKLSSSSPFSRTIRADGRLSGLAVANFHSLGSLTTAPRVCSNQSWNCSIGPGARSASSRPALIYSRRRPARSGRRGRLGAIGSQTIFELEDRLDAESDHTSWSIHRSEEHTSELQSRGHLVCRLLLEKKKA